MKKGDFEQFTQRCASASTGAGQGFPSNTLRPSI
ncbi:hypothetical protein BFJ63_vAg17077 [Fusarium oxysporum f. sp. narcissi]|uniref:Uncharacterized protein n=3 Tax=Fusarium oxysporum TaxID=5507 RepID=A0A420QTP8_FUSOX|nr:hypothetical protein BFJ65_g13367 [Fusarium oxysporum f. sp. cepae]RKK75216.1 hypothetical protein BFJ68_g18120 [Fusarium oxysporum]RYC80039.1 hypothetical protein BFJ63_vAg17077 [Fusarium oxysporum f. sp. narcissi]RKK23709.1 hypothetical protein BFJ67_g17017 [Fusarium oxysporum f. sp. cepae]RKK30679.1 hypothetical protein BFJ66_g16200 [Fusarium oxysporum f. sp. cepae]